MKIFLYIFILVFASNTSFGDIPYPFKKSDEIKSGIIIDHNRKTCFKAWAPEKYFDINKYSKCIEGYVMLLEITGHDKIGLYSTSSYYTINDAISKYCNFDKQIIVDYPKANKGASLICIFRK